MVYEKLEMQHWQGDGGWGGEELATGAGEK